MEVSEEVSSDTILQWLDPVTDTDSLLAAVRDIYESTCITDVTSSSGSNQLNLTRTFSKPLFSYVPLPICFSESQTLSLDSWAGQWEKLSSAVVILISAHPQFNAQHRCKKENALISTVKVLYRLCSGNNRGYYVMYNNDCVYVCHIAQPGGIRCDCGLLQYNCWGYLRPDSISDSHWPPSLNIWPPSLATISQYLILTGHHLSISGHHLSPPSLNI